MIGFSCERLKAQIREHLWIANVEATLEQFVYLQINKSLEWLREYNIQIPDIIGDALHIHRDWLAGNISVQQLNTVSKDLSDYAVKQRSHFPFPTDMFHFLTWLKSPTLLPEDIRDYCKAEVDLLPATIARRLSETIKRDSQFYTLEAIELIEHCHSVMCDYLGWTKMLNEASREAAKHVERIRQFEFVAIGPHLLKPPQSFRIDCNLESPHLDLDLHNQLMNLAPAGYEE